MFELSKRGVVDVIRGEDPICADSLEELAPLLEQCLSLGPPRLVFDMSGVSFIDGAGLDWLLDARDRCSQLGGVLHLACPSSLCCEILRITGVDAQLETFDDAVQAAGSFAR